MLEGKSGRENRFIFYLITKNSQSKVVNIVNIVLLNIYPIHVHEDVTNFDDGSLMIIPCLV